MFEKVRRYFDYEDKLRRIVSKVTGILIIVYNIFSGILLVCLIILLIFGLHRPDTIEILLYMIPGILAGVAILKFCILMVDRLHRGTTIEEYSYLRLLLFASVIVYLLFMVVFVLFGILSGLLKYLI